MRIDSRPFNVLVATRCCACISNKRSCDSQRPVCQSCLDNHEIMCSWKFKRFRNQTIRNPISREPDHQISSATLPISSSVSQHEESKLFFSNEDCIQLLEADGDLQQLLGLVDAEEGEAQCMVTLAVLAINLYRLSDHWESMAVLYYTKAIAAILVKLARVHTDENWQDLALCVALANNFERYDPRHDQRYCHLAGLRDVISQSPPCGTHPSAVSCGVIKSLIYYTAIGSTFSCSQVAQGLDFWYIDELRNKILAASNHNCVESGTHMEIPLQMFDLIFQAGYLRKQASTAFTIGANRNHFSRWRSWLKNDDDTSSSAHAKLLNLLFRKACLVLLAKIEEPWIERDAVKFIRSDAWLALSSLDMSKQSPLIFWPLLILFFAGDSRERSFLRDLFKNLGQAINMRRFDTITDYMDELDRTHGSEDEAAIFNVLLQGDVPQVILL